MKCVLAIVLVVGILVQGGAAARQPVLINLFGSLLQAGTNITTVTGTASILNTIVAGLTQVTVDLQPILQGILGPLNSLLNNIILPTTDYTANTVLPSIAREVTSAVNKLVEIGNSIVTRRQQGLTNLFQRIANRLTGFLDKISERANQGAGRFINIIGDANYVLRSLLASLQSNFEVCGNKLSTLTVGSASGAVASYAQNVTDIFKNLTANMDNEANALASLINTTVTQMTVENVDRTAVFTTNLTAIYDAKEEKSAEFLSCINTNEDMVELLDDIIVDNLNNCVNVSIMETAKASTEFGAQAAALQANTTAISKGTCDCTNNVTILSLLLIRVKTQSCVNTESAVVDSTSIQQQANAIEKAQEEKMATVTENFTKCIVDLNQQITDIIPVINEGFDSCLPL